MVKMYFDKPATYWEEGLPLGNGRIGCVLLGDPESEILYLNEDSLWSGYPIDSQAGMNKEAITRAKKSVAEGDYKQGMDQIEQALKQAQDVQLYEPFGNLMLSFQGKRTITDYKRVLDLNTAAATISYKNNENQYTHTCFISAKADCLIYKIVSEEYFTIKIAAFDGFLKKAKYYDNEFALYGECPGRSGFSKGGIDSRGNVPLFSDKPEERGMTYQGRGKVEIVGGEVICSSDGMYVKHTKQLILRFDIRSSFAGWDIHPYMNGASIEQKFKQNQKKFNQPYDTQLEEHVRDYQTFFHRVNFELGQTESKEDLPKRIKQFAEQKDNSLYALLFHYGRYLLISSSREGTQPANLQGIWNKDKVPPWFCDYTMNINVQMNYWMTGPVNLHELIEPLVRMNIELIHNGKKSAKLFFDAEGTLCFHNTDIWRKTSPPEGSAAWAFWPFASAWMCRNLFDEYLFCQDREYLSRIFPILRENVLFCMNMLEESQDGYVVCPATSPENEFYCGAHKVSVANYTENVQAIVRNLFSDYIQTCCALDIQEELAEKIKFILPRIAPTQIGAEGQILEWDRHWKEVDAEHRHLSHLYELHPGTGICQAYKELFSGAKKSLTMRGEEGTGWSLVWRMIMWARLEEEEWVEHFMQNLIVPVHPTAKMSTRGGGVYSNLMCAHPPFQIDGNLGFVAGVAEILVQSHQNEIVLLPALPKSWNQGKISGLRARGNIIVDIQWQEDKVQYRLVSQTTQTIRLRIKKEIQQNITLVALEPFEGLFSKII